VLLLLHVLVIHSPPERHLLAGLSVFEAFIIIIVKWDVQCLH
jgi:hypothetical protein